MSILKEVQPGRDEHDKFIWCGCPSNVFSMQSCYKYFLQENQNSALETKLKEALEVMWEVKAPPKVKIFTWRVFLDRLSTRVQLIKKSIIPNS